MEVTIDKFGRILIPKKLRRALGIFSGQKVTLSVTTENELRIQPNPPEANLIEEQGLLVVAADEGDYTDIEWDSIIQQKRQDRISHLLNWKE